jgi:AraC family transcriptional regulator
LRHGDVGKLRFDDKPYSPEKMKDIANKVTPVAPLVSSNQAEWNNIFLAYYQQPACEIPKHFLNEHTLTICSELSAPSLVECSLDNRFKRYWFSSGDIIFCPAGISKSLAWEQKNSCILLALEPRLVELVAYDSIYADPIEFLPQFKIIDPLILQIVHALLSELESGCPSGRLYGESAAAMLAIHLLKINSSVRQFVQEYKGGLSKPKLSQIVEYIDEYLAHNIGLSELAEVVGMSQYHFTRLFKQSMGITPYQYLIRKRVERAKRLLLQEKLKIADVALECGFANQGHLSYHFKRLLNITPKAFSCHNSSKNL